MSDTPKPFEFPAHVVASPETKEPTSKIILHGIEAYKEAIVEFRNQIIQMVKDQIISEQTAGRIIIEHEYSFFSQLVSIEYLT